MLRFGLSIILWMIYFKLNLTADDSIHHIETSDLKLPNLSPLPFIYSELEFTPDSEQTSVSIPREFKIAGAGGAVRHTAWPLRAAWDMQYTKNDI